MQLPNPSLPTYLPNLGHAQCLVSVFSLEALHVQLPNPIPTAVKLAPTTFPLNSDPSATATPRDLEARCRSSFSMKEGDARYGRH